MITSARLTILLIRRTTDRVTLVLPVTAFAVVTALALTIFGGARFFFTISEADLSILYALLGTVATILLVVPLLTLCGAAARLSTRRRDDRLATLRLLGAPRRMIAQVTVLEATFLALTGSLLGVIGHLALVPVTGLLRFHGEQLGADRVLISPLGAAGCILGLVAMATVSAIVGLRRVTVSPLGVRTRQQAPRLSIWRLIGFAVVLVRAAAPGTPSTVWGLAVVPPMVSATVGAGLVPHLAPALQIPLLLILAACFGLSLILGGIIFALAYHHHWRVARLPIPASTSAWIPLGVVGQSTAAAQAMAVAAAGLVPAPVAGVLQTVANDYGVLMLALGVPLAAWAVAMTVRGFRARMPFVPGWWSLTFPIGTLALGSHLLGVGTGIAAYLVAGLACWATLCGTWLLCAVASARAVHTRPS